MAAYEADRSLRGKLRRRYSRLIHRRPLTLPEGRPMITFGFDDVPATAVSNGAAVLEDAGVRGTFYVCAGLEGQTGPMGAYGGASETERLLDAGHEVACHTFSHLDCGQAGAAAIAEDVRRNGEALAALGRPAGSGPPPRVAAIALNTALLDGPAAADAQMATAAETGLPCVDPVRQGGEALLDLLQGQERSPTP